MSSVPHFDEMKMHDPVAIFGSKFITVCNCDHTPTQGISHTQAAPPSHTQGCKFNSD